MKQSLKRILKECSKPLIREAFGHEDVNGWLCIGEVPCYPWGNGGDKVYIMANPSKTMFGGRYVYEYVYTENSDGTGKQIRDLPLRDLRFAIIYPKYQEQEIAEKFLGRKKDSEEIKRLHREFQSKLFKLGHLVVLHHTSSYEVKDGNIKKGNPNTYSTNNDIGIYFWGSRHSGKDPSNCGQYIYYALIQESDLYDFDTNEDRVSLDVALKKYKYAGQTWKDGSDAIVVSTLQNTPIWCILDKENGKWYDSEWNEIRKPFK